MSQLKLSGDASGTGIVTIAAPNTNSTYTVTLPAAAGTIITTASAATPTTLGPVYGSMTTGGASPYLTALGYNAAPSASGTYNTAVGSNALNGTTTGFWNTAVGSEALSANVTGQRNTAVGVYALKLNTGDRNTGLGIFALQSNTSGTENTGVGNQALNGNTTGSNNVAVGSYALNANTTANNNTAVGYNALAGSNTNGSNTAVGAVALTTNTTGTQNVAVGGAALQLNTTGSYNTALGLFALYSNTTANNNTAVGQQALYSNTTGYYNVALGTGAAYANTTGISNVAIGQAMNANTTGNRNIAIGSNDGTLTSPLRWNQTGSDNIAIGTSAIGGNGNCSNNVAIGTSALGANTTGQDNVAVGKNAGATGTNDITTGSQNTLLGYYAQAASGTANYQIVIGAECAGQSGVGYVTIGDYSAKIYANYRSSATWTQTSDASMKNVIGPDTLGLSFINRLNPIKFTWKDVNKLPLDHPRYDVRGGLDTTQVIHGFVAQEVKAALDAEGCTTFNGWDQGQDGIQAISREMFISPLVKAVQELSAQVQALQAEIATLKGN